MGRRIAVPAGIDDMGTTVSTWLYEQAWWLVTPRLDMLWVAGLGAFAIVTVWLLKDLAMYPVLRRSLEDDGIDRVGVGRLIGQQGVAEDELAPTGYVRVKGELWQAESVIASGPVSKGSPVRVCAVRGLTLLIEPVSAPDS